MRLLLTSMLLSFEIQWSSVRKEDTMKKVRGNCEMDEQETMTLCALISPRNIRRQVTVISQGSVLIAVWYLDKSTSEIGQQIIIGFFPY